MLTHIMQYLFWILLSVAVLTVLFRLWIEWPNLKKSIEKARADRKAERERVESLEVWFKKLRTEQTAYFERSYEKVPAPWRPQHRAA